MAYNRNHLHLRCRQRRVIPKSLRPGSTVKEHGATGIRQRTQNKLLMKECNRLIVLTTSSAIYAELKTCSSIFKYHIDKICTHTNLFFSKDNIPIELFLKNIILIVHQ